MCFEYTALRIYGCNSVGRMLHLGCSCHRFESCHPYKWGLQCNWLAHHPCKMKVGVQVPHSPLLCFHVFIMLSFCLNPLFGSQRLKKLPINASQFSGKNAWLTSKRSLVRIQQKQQHGFIAQWQSNWLLTNRFQVRILVFPQLDT